MKLDDFICETFKLVANGIKMAQAQTKEQKITVVPANIAFSQGSHVFNDKTGEPIDYIEFNIVVTPEPTQEGQETIFVPTTKPGRDGFSEFNPYMCRLKFSVPVHYPKDSKRYL